MIFLIKIGEEIMGLDVNAGLLAAMGVSFISGVALAFAPCCFPSVIFMGAYVTGKKELSRRQGFFISLCFVSGMILILTFLGLLTGGIASFIKQSPIFFYFISALLIAMGLWQLGVVNLGFLQIRTKQMEYKFKSAYLKAFLMGLPFGITASACTLPITFSVMSYAAIKGSIIYSAVLMLVLAVGKSIPTVLVGTFSGLVKQFKGLGKYHYIVEKIAGVAMIGVAIYLIWIA